MNNTLANNYLSQAPTTLSACPPVRFMAGNEIIINGNVEFVADGENELVLEINDDPCLQGESKCAPIYPDNDKPEDDKVETKEFCTGIYILHMFKISESGVNKLKRKIIIYE